MDDRREAHLIRMARTLRCMREVEGFRAQLAAQGEQITGRLLAALIERETRLKP